MSISIRTTDNAIEDATLYIMNRGKMQRPDLASLVGARTLEREIGEVKINFYSCRNEGYVKLQINHQTIMFEVTHQKYITPLHLDIVRIPPDLSGNKLGCRMVREMLLTAKQWGWEQVDMRAAYGEHYSRKDFFWNGAYTWARMGFDTYDGIVCIDGKPYLLCKLMETQEGRELWKKYAYTEPMSFDLRSNSQSWRTLNSYLR